MTALAQVLITTSVLTCGIICGTDVFSAIALRRALTLVDDRTLVSIMGRVHDFGDRRQRVDRRQVVVALTPAGQRAPAIGRHVRQAWLVQALATRFTPQIRMQVTDAIGVLKRIVDERSRRRTAAECRGRAAGGRPFGPR